MSPDNLNIEKTFRQALQHHETPVPANLWTTIQANIGNVRVVEYPASGSSLIAKGLAVISIAGAIAATSISEIDYYQSNLSDSQNALDVSHDKKSAQERETVIAFDKNQNDTLSQLNTNVEPNSVASAQTNETELEAEPISNTVSSEASDDPQWANETSATYVLVQSNPSEVALQQTKTAEPQNENESASSAVNQQAQSNGGAQDDNEPQRTTAYFTREIPNVFTPNGDGFNDYFFVEGSGFESFSIAVMSRLGAVVFESNSIDFRWDGKDRFGNKIPDGIYFYEIRAFGLDGLPYLEENAKGTINIITK